MSKVWHVPSKKEFGGSWWISSCCGQLAHGLCGVCYCSGLRCVVDLISDIQKYTLSPEKHDPHRHGLRRTCSGTICDGESHSHETGRHHAPGTILHHNHHQRHHPHHRQLPPPPPPPFPPLSPPGPPTPPPPPSPPLNSRKNWSRKLDEKHKVVHHTKSEKSKTHNNIDRLGTVKVTKKFPQRTGWADRVRRLWAKNSAIEKRTAECEIECRIKLWTSSVRSLAME